MVKSAATVHLGKMHKLTELDQPVITIKMIQTVHVNKVHKVARLVQLLKIVKQADLLQLDKMYKKAWSFQLVKITKLAETLRANVNMHQANSGKSPKFVFSPTFMFCNPIGPNNCGVVFWWKYILVFEKWFFSFDRSNMQIFIVNITRVVWPHVTNLLDLRYFCQHNPLFYHLNLIPCHYWSWQRNIYFLVNIFVRHTFSM